MEEIGLGVSPVLTVLPTTIMFMNSMVMLPVELLFCTMR